MLRARPLPTRVILPRQHAQTSCAATAGQRGDYTKELNDAEKRWEGQVQWCRHVLVLPKALSWPAVTASGAFACLPDWVLVLADPGG